MGSREQPCVDHKVYDHDHDWIICLFMIIKMLLCIVQYNWFIYYVQSNILCHHVCCFYRLIASLPTQEAPAEERKEEEEKQRKEKKRKEKKRKEKKRKEKKRKEKTRQERKSPCSPTSV